MKFLGVSAAAALMMLTVFYVTLMLGQFGTVSPCGALKNSFIRHYLDSAGGAPIDLDEAAGKSLALLVTGPLVDRMTSALTTTECLRGLYRLEANPEDFVPSSLGQPVPLREEREIEYALKQVPWRTSRETSPIDGSTSVYLSREAEQDIQGWPGRPVRPVLWLRCLENRTAAIVAFNTLLDPDNGVTDPYHVRLRYRLDDSPAVAETFMLSNDGKSILFPRSIPSIKKMMRSQSLLVEAMPLNGAREFVRFDLTGLEEHIGAVRETCHW